MLQQTVIKAVLPVYARFLERFPTVQTLAAATEEQVRESVRGLGYYRRFRMLHEAAKQLTDAAHARGRCVWPTTYDGWKELPGIGDYTASAISSIAFGYPAAVVDGNVERVFCRLLDIREAPNQPHLKVAFKGLAQDFLAPEHAGDFNQALMELGQTVCTPTSPACGVCPLAAGCLAFARGSQALAPAAKAKPEFRNEELRLGIFYRKRGQVLEIGLAPRSHEARFLKGTAGFATLRKGRDGTWHGDGWHDKAREHVIENGDVSATVKHSITNHKIAARVVGIELGAKATEDLEWVAEGEVERRLVSNLDRKAWHAFERQRREPRPPFEIY